MIVAINSCNKLKKLRNDCTGNYRFHVTRTSYDDFSGSSSHSYVDTGTVALFQGYSGNQDNIDEKLAITLKPDGQLTTDATSCYNDLKYGYYDFIHPTLDIDGNLTYPEFECFGWSYHSNFSGSFVGDSVYLEYGFSSATHGSHTSVKGVILY